MSADKAKLSETEREIVKTLLDTAAVDFKAIGEALSRYGPSAATALDFEDVFCGTMRRFVRVFRLAGEVQVPLEELARLREVSGELHG